MHSTPLNKSLRHFWFKNNDILMTKFSMQKACSSSLAIRYTSKKICGETLIASVSFKSKISFYYHNFAKKSSDWSLLQFCPLRKKGYLTIYKKLGIDLFPFQFFLMIYFLLTFFQIFRLKKIEGIMTFHLRSDISK